MSVGKSFAPWVKWFTLALLLASALALSYFAFGKGQYVSIPSTIPILNGEIIPFSVRELVSLATPIVAWVLAMIFHVLDKRFRGGGIKDRVDIVTKLTGRSYDLTPGAIAATMTKQSVLIAIAAILLGVVQAYHRGSGDAVVIRESEFKIFSSRASMLGFLLSIVLLLVSLKCYDYACRFNLKDLYKAELIKKGLVLDIWSWYLILFSLVIGVASLSTTVSIAVSFVVGYLLWWYYFIHPKSEHYR